VSEFSSAEIAELMQFIGDDDRLLLDSFLRESQLAWEPLPGPQTMAFESDADVIGFGGAAGGGKTDLACGLALHKHIRTAIFRREGSQMSGIIDRLKEMVGHDKGYVGSGRWWGWRDPLPGKTIEFGSVPNLGDEKNHQGRPKDLLVFDEAANFLEAQVRFLMGWVRTTVAGQKCQTLLTFNPPTTSEGRWIIEFFKPWLDKKHPRPALPGELRWFASIDGKDHEVPDNRPFVMVHGDRLYEFDADQFKEQDIIRPMSRTFIPSRVSDNPYLTGTGYMSTLQSLPEPLRSQMLYGDFQAGVQDDPWQVIPTAWAEAAMDRWTKPAKLPEMLSLGIDVARGGQDNTIIARRHEGMWFDHALVYPGAQTPNGPAVAGLVLASQRDAAPMHIDVIGVGASPYDFLVQARQQISGVNVSEKALGTDRSGRLKFKNLRSQLWWMMREALDPSNNTGIALPPDRQLLADLCAPTWELQGSIVYVEGRDDIVKRIGRSPDWASAYILALIDTPKRHLVGQQHRENSAMNYNPIAQFSSFHNGAARDYDPLGFNR
jgi:hypothetical protein